MNLCVCVCVCVCVCLDEKWQIPIITNKFVNFFSPTLYLKIHSTLFHLKLIDLDFKIDLKFKLGLKLASNTT